MAFLSEVFRKYCTVQSYLEGFLSGKLMFNNADNWCIIEKVIVEADLNWLTLYDSSQIVHTG